VSIIKPGDGEGGVNNDVNGIQKDWSRVHSGEQKSPIKNAGRTSKRNQSNPL